MRAGDAAAAAATAAARAGVMGVPGGRRPYRPPPGTAAEAPAGRSAGDDPKGEAAGPRRGVIARTTCACAACSTPMCATISRSFSRSSAATSAGEWAPPGGACPGVPTTPPPTRGDGGTAMARGGLGGNIDAARDRSGGGEGERDRVAALFERDPCGGPGGLGGRGTSAAGVLPPAPGVEAKDAAVATMCWGDTTGGGGRGTAYGGDPPDAPPSPPTPDTEEARKPRAATAGGDVPAAPPPGTVASGAPRLSTRAAASTRPKGEPPAPGGRGAVLGESPPPRPRAVRSTESPPGSARRCGLSEAACAARSALASAGLRSRALAAATAGDDKTAGAPRRAGEDGGCSRGVDVVAAAAAARCGTGLFGCWGCCCGGTSRLTARSRLVEEGRGEVCPPADNAAPAAAGDSTALPRDGELGVGAETAARPALSLRDSKARGPGG